MDSKGQLTTKEELILKILWNADKPLIASEVAKTGGQSINTVQVVLRMLLKRKLIEVADIVQSGTVLCRSYRPTIIAEQYIMRIFSDQYRVLSKRISPSSLFAALIESEKNEDKVITALEEMIAQKRKLHPKE